MQLPVSGTFTKGFLGGQGDITVTAAPGLAATLDPDAPFPPDARDLVVAEVAASSPKLEFGGDGPIHCSTTFSGHAAAGVQLLRPGDTSDFLSAYVPDFTVASGGLGVRFFASADGKVSVSGSVPAITGLSFGVNAGGNVLFSRLVTVPASTPARSAVLEALSDVRLPQNRGTPSDMPKAGEAVIFEYGGFLELRAALTWGYSLTATESLDVGQLETSLMYDLRMKANVSLGYRLAGDFVMVVQPGSLPGWVRLAVRKKRDSTFDFAAGFTLDARAKLDFAAETVDEVLIAFFGADARRALRLFDEFKSFTDLDALERRAGKVLFASLQTLSHKWIGKALDDTSLGDFVTVIGRVVEASKTIDAKVLDVYEDFLKRSKLTELRTSLQKLVALARKDDLSTITDRDTWTLIRRLGASTLFSALENNDDFANLLSAAKQALAFLDGSELKDLLDRLHEDLKLDEIFGTLERFSSKEEILGLTDKRLQGVIEKIVGKTFDEIRASDVGKTLADVRKVLTRVDAFRNEMIARLEDALDRSASIEINYAYTRTTSDKALLDMEFDVRQTRGVELFNLASAGKFGDVMSEASLAFVRVREAALTHRVSRASELQINFVGWKLGRLVELVTETNIALEAHDGGLVQAFTTTASVTQRREKGRSQKEVSQTAFLLTLAGTLSQNPATSADAARRRFLVETLNRMSVGYESQQSDDVTTPAELFDYLLLARWLEVIPPAAGDPPELPLSAAPGGLPSVDAFIDRLRRQFPKGLGKVSVKYVVRYDDDTLRDAFTALSGKELEARVRLSCRRMIGTYLMRPSNGLFHVALGAAYALPGNARDMFDREGFNPIGQQRFLVTIPGSVPKFAGKQQALEPTSGGNGGSERLRQLFLYEQELVKRVRKLDDKVDEARKDKTTVTVSELEEVSTNVLKSAANIDESGGVNAFFGVMDDLIQQGRSGKGRRTSSVILEIDPPEGEPVTQFLLPGAQR